MTHAKFDSIAVILRFQSLKLVDKRSIIDNGRYRWSTQKPTQSM